MPKLNPPDDPKLRSLREQGTLNPRPQVVTDDLFAASEFFDPRDLIQVKYEMLRRVEKDGQSVTEAASRFGFSRPSFYQAQSALAQRGLAGLIPLKRGPKQARKLSTAVLEFIRQARQEDASVSTRDLVGRIQERFEITVHPRTIERGLARDQKKRRRHNEFSNGQRNDELVAGYEQLRKDALCPAGRSAGPGLALFLRKGMTAWMRAWSSCMPATAAVVTSPAIAISICPQDIRAQLAVLLAGLILGQQQEATT